MAIKSSFLRIEGQASCAFLDDIDESMVLASNHGSMYYFFDENKQFLIFTSEQKALEDIVIKNFGKMCLIIDAMFDENQGSCLSLEKSHIMHQTKLKKPVV